MSTTPVKSCMICFDDLTEDATFLIACQHSFHKECIINWINIQRTCPACRSLTGRCSLIDSRVEQKPLTDEDKANHLKCLLEECVRRIYPISDVMSVATEYCLTRINQRCKPLLDENKRLMEKMVDSITPSNTKETKNVYFQMGETSQNQQRDAKSSCVSASTLFEGHISSNQTSEVSSLSFSTDTSPKCAPKNLLSLLPEKSPQENLSDENVFFEENHNGVLASLQKKISKKKNTEPSTQTIKMMSILNNVSVLEEAVTNDSECSVVPVEEVIPTLIIKNISINENNDEQPIRSPFVSSLVGKHVIDKNIPKSYKEKKLPTPPSKNLELFNDKKFDEEIRKLKVSILFMHPLISNKEKPQDKKEGAKSTQESFLDLIKITKMCKEIKNEATQFTIKTERTIEECEELLESAEEVLKANKKEQQECSQLLREMDKTLKEIEQGTEKFWENFKELNTQLKKNLRTILEGGGENEQRVLKENIRMLSKTIKESAINIKKTKEDILMSRQNTEQNLKNAEKSFSNAEESLRYAEKSFSNAEESFSNAEESIVMAKEIEEELKQMEAFDKKQKTFIGRALLIYFIFFAMFRQFNSFQISKL